MVTDLKVEIVKMGFKQIEVARLAKIDRSRLNLIVNGWLNPKPEEVQRIKQVLSEKAKE